MRIDGRLFPKECDRIEQDLGSTDDNPSTVAELADCLAGSGLVPREDRVAGAKKDIEQGAYSPESDRFTLPSP